MLCTIYKSTKKDGAYLYVAKRDDFSAVPDELMHMFGKPVLVMTLNIATRELALVDVNKVKESITEKGFFLQLPPPPKNLLEEYKASKQQQQ
ncbi:YcgL domain-containing protein [Vibrio agarivorans]|uniref:YcgL domain-containing protein QWJ08_05400 n=1 Tax=Vibrio agarivorans TaxID=153622 RepID=A0ABT7XYG8_9VIBR|nr:YcgL domain-containing protein [Vibrio agarivorans]MDN2480822.1 YcgL domain-containing protein [Vibrio agarivorans]MDN3663022.1 YcgL domain-containing protein [Vibrio agarivorans]